MTKVLADYVTRVRQLLPQIEYDLEDLDPDDDDTPTGIQVEANIRAALLDYARFKPRLRLHTIAGDGTTYEWELPADYDGSLSRVLAIEYPAGAREPTYLTSRDYSVRLVLDDNDQEVWAIRLLNDTPTATQTLVVRYSAPHILTALTSTIPDTDLEAICHQACYLLATAAAGYFASQKRSTLEANTINHRSKADEWRALAKLFGENFRLSLGMRSGDSVPAGGLRAPMTRASSLFH